VPPSRRLQAGALLFAILLTLSIALAPSPSGAWRPLAGWACVLLAWAPLRTILFQRGAGAVRQLVWASDGRWRIRTRAGWASADISSRTAALGPWILLVWKGSNRTCYALIDAAYVSRGAFRALRGRLKLALSRANPK
jgi:hypothetical protein